MVQRAERITRDFFWLCASRRIARAVPNVRTHACMRTRACSHTRTHSARMHAYAHARMHTRTHALACVCTQMGNMSWVYFFDLALRGPARLLHLGDFHGTHACARARTRAHTHTGMHAGCGMPFLATPLRVQDISDMIT